MELCMMKCNITSNHNISHLRHQLRVRNKSREVGAMQLYVVDAKHYGELVLEPKP